MKPSNLDTLQQSANTLRKDGKTLEALAIYEQLIKLEPDFAPTYNNIGTAYHALGRYEEALTYYQQALDRRDHYLEVYYNMGLSLLALKKIQEAESAFLAIIDKDPKNLHAHYQLGKLAFLQQHFEKAIEHFGWARQQGPALVELYLNLGHCYSEMKNPIEAERYYCGALELTPDDPGIYFNLGVVMEAQGELKSAMTAYQEALVRDPNHFNACNNIAVMMLRSQNLPQALVYFKRALLLKPGSEALCYIVDMISQDKRLEAAPTEYIKQLFNSYADMFEEHVKSSLSYAIPEEILKILKKLLPRPEKQFEIIDLGCGTGLCGALFGSYAKSLVGVDLSENMLKIAAQKNVYDALISEDLMLYLEQQAHAVDIVLAADVFVYIGKLDVIVERCHKTLKPGGFFCFSVEASFGEKDFVSHASGRFSHTKNYLERLAKLYHFKIVACEQVVSRVQRGQPVLGFVYCFKNS